LLALAEVTIVPSSARGSTTIVTGATVTPRGAPQLTGNVDLGPTLERISKGGANPHANDGSVHVNKGRNAARKAQRVLSRVRSSNARRARPRPSAGVTGAGGEAYYSPDHYKTFVPLQ
jgi:filamentous hemagglutinin